MAVVWFVIWGVIGATLGADRPKVGSGAGAVVGMLFGPLGAMFIAISPKAKPEPVSVLGRIEARPDAQGWHPDPLGRFDSRWYDGEKWTQHVGRVGPDGSRGQFEDPI